MKEQNRSLHIISYQAVSQDLQGFIHCIMPSYGSVLSLFTNKISSNAWSLAMSLSKIIH